MYVSYHPYTGLRHSLQQLNRVTKSAEPLHLSPHEYLEIGSSILALDPVLLYGHNEGQNDKGGFEQNKFNCSDNIDIFVGRGRWWSPRGTFVGRGREILMLQQIKELVPKLKSKVRF